MTQVYDKVIELMTVYLTHEWIKASNVNFKPETTFEYLETDILDEVEISLLVEEEFGIPEIPNDMDWFVDIKSLCDYIEANK